MADHFGAAARDGWDHWAVLTEVGEDTDNRVMRTLRWKPGQRCSRAALHLRLIHPGRDPDLPHSGGRQHLKVAGCKYSDTLEMVS